MTKARLAWGTTSQGALVPLWWRNVGSGSSSCAAGQLTYGTSTGEPGCVIQPLDEHGQPHWAG